MFESQTVRLYRSTEIRWASKCMKCRLHIVSYALRASWNEADPDLDADGEDAYGMRFDFKKETPA